MQPSPASPVAQLAREMFEVQARRNPGWATDLGIHAWDHELGDPGKARVLQDISLHQDWLRRADALLPAARALPHREQVDLAALQYSLRLWLHEELVLRSWARNPDLAMEFLDHVFGLLVKDELPVEQRCAAIAARLDGAPGFLRAGRDRFEAERCPPLWVAIAVESARGAPAMLDAAEQLAGSAGVSAATRERVRSAAKQAREALREHEDWLRGLAGQARGSWAAGRAAFDATIALRMLGADADAILARGQELVRVLTRDTTRAAEALLGEAGEAAGSDPVGRAQALLAREHPADWPGVLQAYRDSIAAARDFVARNGIAAVPPGERLEVVETPGYLRHLMPFAAYVSPGRFERQQVGVYLVTPRAPEQFPWADILNTTVHEGYPGHHLQLSGANRNPSLARLFVHATETIEGWAHYCEELMLEAGFTAGPAGLGSSAEAVRFVVLKDQLWRACRIVIDVGIHRGTMGFDEAVRMLRDRARMQEEQARAEVNRYTQSPGYQLSYLWGKRLIQQLRGEARQRGMPPRQFHDRYVAAGSLPLALMAQELGVPLGAPGA